MELRVLNYFLVVAQEENITRAAQLLHLSQPTLSRQLMQLEQELGVKLFARSSHSIRLTREGLLLRRRAQELVSLADKTLRDFSGAEDALAGDIAIGGGETLSVTFLAEKLASFQALHPRVNLRLHSGNADDIKERLDNGLLDLGLLIEPVNIAKYEFIRLDIREEYGVLVRADSPLYSKPAVSARDLLHIPLLVPVRAQVQTELANWFGAAVEELDIRMTFNLLYNAAEMVRAGLGSALCIRLNNSFEGLRFVPFEPQLSFRSVLAWKKHLAYAPAFSALLEHIKK